jgi:2,4-dienoyl-CoA reductase-like NADH-dependent reductase (Old Yellow Enzyme family)
MTQKKSGKEKGLTASRKGFTHLLSPITIGPVDLKNRISLAPMNETFSGMNGEATDQMIAYYAARAKGGAGLISTGAIFGTKLSSEFVWTRNLYCFHPGHLQGLTRLTDTIHYFGAKACAQMSIGFGRQGHSYDHTLLAPAPTGGLPYEISIEKSPRGVEPVLKMAEFARSFLVGQMTRAMTIDEIRSEQKEFAASCQLAVAAGFDVIEIHAPHGYLEHQFLSPLTNKRTDMYGGEWRNRKRFLNEVAEQVRYACPGTAVGARISAEEHVEGGLTREEMIDAAKDMEARGLDYVSLSDGSGYEEGGHLIPDADRAEHIPDTAKDFKAALKIPVIVPSQHDPYKADADVAAGKFDIAALGRQLFCDPDYPTKLAEGRADDIVFCKRCNICLMRCIIGCGPACPQNPNLGREYVMDVYRIGPRQKHEPILPAGITGARMPDLNRPWWKSETPVLEENWRSFRGPGPR